MIVIAKKKSFARVNLECRDGTVVRALASVGGFSLGTPVFPDLLKNQPDKPVNL